MVSPARSGIVSQTRHSLIISPARNVPGLGRLRPAGSTRVAIMATPHATEERHATWLELFFDLVIVAAVAQLAELLHEGVDAERVVLFGAGYYAMWSVWTAFTLYANVSGIRTRQRAVLA